MSLLEVHPAYRAAFRACGLTSGEDFLRLQGEILGGHPDRHVLRVTLFSRDAERSADVHASLRVAAKQGAVAVLEEPAQAAATIPIFLKKDHHVGWRDRLAHAWLGFGWVAKCTREGQMLRQAEQAGIGCPRALAWGEAQGRAFLAVRAEPGVIDLRVYLQEHPGERRAVARALGRAIARMHAAGFFHRDLSSKHVLIAEDGGGYRFCFLDWQRACRLERLSWHQRLADLAMLDATLADAWASLRDRMTCWQAYLDASAVGGHTVRYAEGRGQPARPSEYVRACHPRRRRLLDLLCRLSAALGRKRRIRELRQLPLPAGAQNLLWLDGEALCVTRQFLDEVQTPPAWLQAPRAPRAAGHREVVSIPAPRGGSWRLVRRWSSRPMAWLTNRWRQRSFPAPEFEQAAALVRLERYGLEVPRLLALGHRPLGLWRRYSFLLLEPPQGTVPLVAYLRHAELSERRRLLGQAGRALARVHEAGYGCKGQALNAVAVRPDTGAVVLGSVEPFQRRRGSTQQLTRRDFARLLEAPWPGGSWTDRLRFVLGYFGHEALTPSTRQLLRRLLKAWTRARRRRHRSERRVA
jgi:hypothetical protein